MTHLTHWSVKILENIKDSGPFENGAELHAEMEEASAQAMAIIEGAAKYTEEVDQHNVENPKPDEVRTKREIEEEVKVRVTKLNLSQEQFIYLYNFDISYW